VEVGKGDKTIVLTSLSALGDPVGILIGQISYPSTRDDSARRQQSTIIKAYMDILTAVKARE
jgi:hypothetical protein